MSDLDFSCCGLQNGACSRQIPYDIEEHDKMIFQQGRAQGIDELADELLKVCHDYNSVYDGKIIDIKERLKENK